MFSRLHHFIKENISSSKLWKCSFSISMSFYMATLLTDFLAVTVSSFISTMSEGRQFWQACSSPVFNSYLVDCCNDFSRIYPDIILSLDFQKKPLYMAVYAVIVIVKVVSEVSYCSLNGCFHFKGYQTFTFKSFRGWNNFFQCQGICKSMLYSSSS